MYIDTAIYRFKDNAGNLYTENEVMDFILAGYQEEDFEEEYKIIQKELKRLGLKS